MHLHYVCVAVAAAGYHEINLAKIYKNNFYFKYFWMSKIL